MSKKSSYLWSRNLLLQTNLNNKLTTNTICEKLKSQPQPLAKQQTKQNKEINCRRKLYKTANTTKRCITSKDKFRVYNCLPNNRVRITPTTKRNVTRTLHFHENSLWLGVGVEKILQNQTPTEWRQQFSKNCQNNENENYNLHMNCKCSVKLVNLPYPQCHQYQQLHLQPHHNCQYVLEKCKTHKSHSTLQSYKTNSLPTTSHINSKMDKCLAYVHVIPLKLDKNHHCHHSLYYDGGGGVCSITKILQLHDVKSSVSHVTQLTKYRHHHRYHHDSQLTWLPQVSQHQEHLLGMFEVLPPIFLSKSTPSLPLPYESLKPGIIPKNQHQKQHQCHSDVASMKPKMSHSLPQRHMKHFIVDYHRAMKYLHKTKSKPSDRDVIFGNACILLSKCYGWETSRIEWLLQLEQKYQTHSTSKISNRTNKC